jgi:hypothetical protein
MLYWLKRLNDALALYDPLFIIPLLQANFIFFAIISGGIFYQVLVRRLIVVEAPSRRRCF